MLFLLKLILAPILVAAATLVARRWGPKAGGILVGFPLSTGPIFLFLAIEQGLAFAERAAVGILFGLVGVAAFALAYIAASRRTGWIGSLALAALCFLVVSACISRIESGVIGAGLAAYAALGVAILVIGHRRYDRVRRAQPWWDLWLRMVAATILTLAITEAAGWLGPVLSGVVGTYPVVSSVVVTFTHNQWGRDAAVAMIRGSVLSWVSFASCFLIIGLTLKAFGLSLSIGLGVSGAVATSVLVLWLERRADRPLERKRAHG